MEYVNKKIVNKDANKVQILKAVDMINSIETGMNKPTDNERSKNKITKGINPF